MDHFKGRRPQMTGPLLRVHHDGMGPCICDPFRREIGFERTGPGPDREPGEIIRVQSDIAFFDHDQTPVMSGWRVVREANVGC